jgi:hypothetical protein
MNIVMIHDADGVSQPSILCDVCCLEILDDRQAMVKWWSPRDGPLPPDTQPMIVCHKFTCDQGSAGWEHPNRWNCDQLDDFLGRMVRSVKAERMSA